MFSKLIELEAILASMTGGAGISELSESQTQALVNTCQRLAFEALAECPKPD